MKSTLLSYAADTSSLSPRPPVFVTPFAKAPAIKVTATSSPVRRPDFSGTSRRKQIFRRNLAGMAMALLAVMHTSTAVAQISDDAFATYSEKLTEGKCHYTGWLSSERQLENYLKTYECAPELTDFLSKANFAKQEILLYEFLHAGSGMNWPSYKVTRNDKTLRCEAFDANKDLMRTADLREGTFFFAIIVDKKKIESVDVRDTLGRTPGRVFYTSLGEEMDLHLAARLIMGFPEHAGKTNAEVIGLSHMSLVGYNLSVQDLQALATLPNLERLEVGANNWSIEKIDILNTFPRLRQLHVRTQYFGWNGTNEDSQEFGDKHLARLNMPKLSALSLVHTRVSNQGLQHLANFPELQEITLYGTISLTEETAQDLAKVKSLRAIYRIMCDNPKAIAVLGGLPNLQKLWIGLNCDSHEAMRELGKLEGLTYLHVETKLDTSDEDVSALSGLTDLEYLGLVGYNNVTDDGLAHLKGMKNLKELSLGRCMKIGDEGIKHLLHLPIERLDLRQTGISDNGVLLIAQNFKGLSDLNLRHVKSISTNSEPFFRQMKNLKHLCEFFHSDPKFALDGVQFYNHDLPFSDSTY